MSHRKQAEKKAHEPGTFRDVFREFAVPLGRSSANQDRSLNPDGKEQPNTVLRPATNVNVFSKSARRVMPSGAPGPSKASLNRKIPQNLVVAGPLPKSRGISSYTAAARKVSQLGRERVQETIAAAITRCGITKRKKTPTTGNSARLQNIPGCSKKRSPVPSQPRVHDMLLKKKMTAKEFLKKIPKRVPKSAGKGLKKALLEAAGRPGYKPKVAVGKGFKKNSKNPYDAERRNKKRHLAHDFDGVAQERRRLTRLLQSGEFSIELTNRFLPQILTRINKVKLPYRPMARNRSPKVRARIDRYIRDKMLASYIHSKKTPSSATIGTTDGIQENSATGSATRRRPFKTPGKRQFVVLRRTAQEQPMLLERQSFVEENAPEPAQEMNTKKQRPMLPPLPVPPLPPLRALKPLPVPPLPALEPLPVPPLPVLEAPLLPSGDAGAAHLVAPMPIVQQKKKLLISYEALKKLQSLYLAANTGRSTSSGANHVELASKENRPHNIKGPFAENSGAVVAKKKFLPCPPHKTLRECLIKKEIVEGPASNSVAIVQPVMHVPTRSVARENEDDDVVIRKYIPGKKQPQRIKEEPSD